VSIKHANQAAVDLILASVSGLEVWQCNVAILLVLSFA